jgi:hypothetical protein
MAERTDELTVITKTYDLILWSCQHTSRFPRNHRFVLGERIERRLYDLLETLIQAKYTKSRQCEGAGIQRPFGWLHHSCPVFLPSGLVECSCRVTVALPSCRG